MNDHPAPADPVSPAHSGTEVPATWQQRKSAKTRERVLQATIDCIFEIGYPLTTTDRIAARAKVSRGAMLHHFPNRKALIVAAVRFLNAQRLANFLCAEERIQTDKQRSHIGAGIDVYWNQLATPEFVVLQELQVLARTNTELRTALDAAMTDYDTAWQATAERVFPDLSASRQHELATLVTQFLCAGMALHRSHQLGGDQPDSCVGAPPGDVTPSEKMVLDALKDFLRASYSDVRPATTSQSDLAGAPVGQRTPPLSGRFKENRQG